MKRLTKTLLSRETYRRWCPCTWGHQRCASHLFLSCFPPSHQRICLWDYLSSNIAFNFSLFLSLSPQQFLKIILRPEHVTNSTFSLFISKNQEHGVLVNSIKFSTIDSLIVFLTINSRTVYYYYSELNNWIVDKLWTPKFQNKDTQLLLLLRPSACVGFYHKSYLW